MRDTRIRPAIALSSVIALQGCIFFPPDAPTDFALDSVRLVTLDHLPAAAREEMDTRYRISEWDHRQSKSAKPEQMLRDLKPFEPKQMLEVSISTTGSANYLADNYELLGTVAVRCADWDRAQAYDRRVYEDGNTLNGGKYPESFQLTDILYLNSAITHEVDYDRYTSGGRDAGGHYHYQTYVKIPSPAEDLCLQVGGWVMSPFQGDPGNIVIIPGSAIDVALAEAK